MEDENMQPVAYMHPDGNVLRARSKKYHLQQTKEPRVLRRIEEFRIGLYTEDQVAAKIRAAVLAERAACAAIAESYADVYFDSNAPTDQGRRMAGDTIASEIRARPAP